MSDDPNYGLFNEERHEAHRPAGTWLFVLAAVAIALAVAALLRAGQLQTRVATLEAANTAARASVDGLRAELTALADREGAADRALRRELDRLDDLARDLTALTAATAELQDRRGTPQRASLRFEAAALLELANRLLLLGRDIDAAIGALESADARLAQLREPAIARIRERVAADLQALRAVPRPDTESVVRRLEAAEDAIAGLPVRGLAEPGGVARVPESDGVLSRAGRVLRQALLSLVTIRRTESVAGDLVTLDEQSLRRQHLQLLLYGTRLSVARSDQSGYTQGLAEAGAFVDRHFETGDARVAQLRAELEALAATVIAPVLPDVSGAARLLQQAPP